MSVHASTLAQLALSIPEEVKTRNGELKHVLVTHSPAGEQMVRLVLRSPGQLTRVRRGLDDCHPVAGEHRAGREPPPPAP